MKAWLGLSIIALFAGASAQASLSFEDALAKIVERSTAVQAQQYKADSTEASYLPTKLAYLPALSLDAGWLNPGSTIGSSPAVSSDTFLGFTQRQAEIQGKVNLFRFGSDAAAIRSANLDEEGQRLLIDDQTLAAEKSGVTALVQVIQYHKQIDVLAKMVELESSALEIGRERYKRGYLPEQEVDRLQVDLENVRARKSDTEILEAQARAALVALLGSDDVVVEWPWHDALTAWKGGERLPAPDLSMRPDWRSAQKEVESADELETSKYRLLYPSLDAAAASGYYSDAVGASFQWAWSGSLLLNFPLFDRLTTLSNARVQAYAKKQAEVTLETVRRQAQSEWDSALAGFRTALSSARSRDQVLRKSREIYQDQLRRFQLGKISANDLAVDEQRFHDSELLAVNGWAAVHVNLADLCHARGLRVSGDWERCWLQ